jgi:hypothetical protein
MNVVGWSYVAGGFFFAGMVLLCVTLLFVNEATRFRRWLAVGLAVVIGSTVIWWWLVAGSFADRIG